MQNNNKIKNITYENDNKTFTIEYCLESETFLCFTLRSLIKLG